MAAFQRGMGLAEAQEHTKPDPPSAARQHAYVPAADGSGRLDGSAPAG
ncbi:hypothetical protein H4K36_31655 [Streptomyces sp. DHE7-1]|nr:hypothetical protein [Streptomyces sp. DHE7-1]